MSTTGKKIYFKIAQFKYGVISFKYLIRIFSVSLILCVNSTTPGLISVISQLSKTRYKKNSTPVNYIICLHGTRMRNFCSLHGSHNGKFLQSTREGQITLLFRIRLHSCEHSHSDSRALHFSKQWLIPFKIQLWLRNTEATGSARNAEVTDTGQSTLNKVAGFSSDACSSVTNAFRRFRSMIQFFSKCHDILLNCHPLGLLRPEKPITFFKHALYQGSLPLLGNPQDIAGSGKPLWQLRGQTTFLQQWPGPIWAHGLR